ncbi:MAG: hypothetical protein IKK09_06900 [Clostridia bacterium]|nr:hypothetical protein [Clostridia bacterium]
MKRILTGAAVALAAMSGLTVQSFAATVDLPPVFDSISPILEFFLRIVEVLAKVISFFS